MDQNKLVMEPIEWYRVRLIGEPVLGDQRNPSTKQNGLYFCDDGERYIFRDIYPDGRFTDTFFNRDAVVQLVVKHGSEVDNGGEE